MSSPLPPFFPRHSTLAVLLAATFVVMACGTTQEAKREVQPGLTQLRVAEFEIQGAEKFGADELKSGLATQEDPGWRAAVPWMPLIGAEHQYYNRIDWRRDLERIRTFYRQRGYFNASIVSQNIVESREEGTVRIRLRIDEGEPTKVQELQIEGLEPLDPEARQEVVSDLPISEGGVFTQENYLEARRRLVRRLKKRSYAYAEISGRAVINPRTGDAEVFYFLDPGPRAVFGKIHIIGNDEIAAERVRTAITLEEGQPYSGEALEEAQDDIYDMEVFSLVSVLPAHEAEERVLEEAGISSAEISETEAAEEPTGQAYPDIPQGQEGPQEVDEPMEKIGPDVEEEVEDVREAEVGVPGALGISDVLASAQEQAETRIQLERRVPIIIRLKEARMWNVELGAGLSIESNRATVFGQANWSSRNFLGGLRKLEHFNTVGYAWAANTGDSSLSPPSIFGGTESEAANQGVFLESRLEFRQPQFLERKTSLVVTPSVRRGIEVGYTVWNPQATIGLERPFFDHLTVGLNYHIAYYNYSNVGDALLTQTELGIDFQREFLLEWLEQRFTLDYTDSAINPTEGVLTALSLQEARSYLAGGEFQFFKVLLGTEGYVPFDLFTNWVLASRFRIGAIYNTEPTETGAGGEVETQTIPTQNRLYGGGRNSFRALGHRNLSFFRVGQFDPRDSEEVDTVEVIPIGGLSLFEASIEPRFELVENLADIGPLWGVLFYDVGTVLDEQLFFSTAASESLDRGTASFNDITSSLIHGVGAGAFWVTPVGPVRADFALTLNDLSNDPRFRTCGPQNRVQTEVTQTGRSDCEFLPPEQDPIQQQLNLDFSFFIGIGHSF